MRLFLPLIVCLSIFLNNSNATAQHPVSGMDIPALNMIDDMMTTYLDTSGLDCAVVGMSYLGEIKYLRAFGWSDENKSIPLQENATFRVASITKTFTAAITRDLIERGLLNLTDKAFNLESNGGILDILPVPEIIDPRVRDITVEHLLNHMAGWDRNEAPDLTGNDLLIKEEMELDHLPSAMEMLSWILEHELEYSPGQDSEYSNEGYLALGLVNNAVSDLDLLTYVQTRLLKSSELWFPRNDFFMGRSFAEDQDPREPYYFDPDFSINVFAPESAPVRQPYGSWNHEVKESYGSMVSSAVPMLNQANLFYLNDADRGKPIDQFHGTHRHGGAQPGNNSELMQRDDGVDFIVMTNQYLNLDSLNARKIRNNIIEILDTQYIPWISLENVDCVWFDTSYSGEEQGTYLLPYGSVNDLGNIHAYTKVKFKPGATVSLPKIRTI